MALLDAVEAGQAHAPEIIIGRVVLHVEHDEVVDLVLAARCGHDGLDAAKAAGLRRLNELGLERRRGRLAVVVRAVVVGAERDGEADGEEEGELHGVSRYNRPR
jgi:hypothetical protein